MSFQKSKTLGKRCSWGKQAREALTSRLREPGEAEADDIERSEKGRQWLPSLPRSQGRVWIQNVNVGEPRISVDPQG